MSSQQPVGFLSLPLELRLCIYEKVLVRPFQVIPRLQPLAEEPSVSSILRTCKQINSEASRILYSKNSFSLVNPGRYLWCFNQIGKANISKLEHLSIYVFPLIVSTETILWCKLFDQLARDAKGLRHIGITWDSFLPYHGLNLDRKFVRKLAKTQGLKTLIVSEYHAKNWSKYLTETMGASVQEESHWPHFAAIMNAHYRDNACC